MGAGSFGIVAKLLPDFARRVGGSRRGRETIGKDKQRVVRCERRQRWACRRRREGGRTYQPNVLKGCHWKGRSSRSWEAGDSARNGLLYQGMGRATSCDKEDYVFTELWWKISSANKKGSENIDRGSVFARSISISAGGETTFICCNPSRRGERKKDSKLSSEARSRKKEAP